jgi:alkanesulfonate monooxygenase SsuD/methylene tetrahydromethanopterin reductase-like flavin-dependent oxidoreductase (luciferase family)
VSGVSIGIQGSGQQVDGMPDPGVYRELAQTAEELGYDSIWAGDHISFRNPLLDIVVALTTFAAVTDRITLGAGILLLPLRHPSVVAKEFASLDYLSGGRVILGVGVGGEGGKDFEAVGVDVHERGARVGGRSDAAIRRAATLGDGWIPIWVSVEAFRRGLEQLPERVVPAVTLPAHVGDKRTLYEHLRRRYGGDFSEHVVDRYCVAGNPDECAARVRAYVEAGARHLVFNVAAPEDVERLAEVALAATG